MLDPAIQTTFEACLDAARRGDREALESCLDPAVEGFEPLGGPCVGSGPVAGAIAGLRTRMPDLDITPLRTYGEGPELAVRVRLTSRGREAEGVWAFRFDPGDKVSRLVALFDPSRLLPEPESSLDHGREARIIEYFRTYNADAEDAHMALISPSLVYFGAVSRMTVEGIETARGIFRSARTRMGLKRFDPIRLFGGGDHAAVLVRIHGAQAGGPSEEAVWVFRFDARDLLDRVSILWNPGVFLAWPLKPGP